MRLKKATIIKVVYAKEVYKKIKELENKKEVNCRLLYEAMVTYIASMGTTINNNIDNREEKLFATLSSSGWQECSYTEDDLMNNFSVLLKFCIKNISKIKDTAAVQNNISVLSSVVEKTEEEKKSILKEKEKLKSMFDAILSIFSEYNLRGVEDLLLKADDMDLSFLNDYENCWSAYEYYEYSEIYFKTNCLINGRQESYNMIRNIIFNGENNKILENRKDFKIISINQYKKEILDKSSYNRDNSYQYNMLINDFLLYNSHFYTSENRKSEIQSNYCFNNNSDSLNEGTAVTSNEYIKYYLLDNSLDAIENKMISNAITEKRIKLAIQRKTISSNCFDIVFVPISFENTINETSEYITDAIKVESNNIDTINKSILLARDNGIIIIDLSTQNMTARMIKTLSRKLSDITIFHHDISDAESQCKYLLDGKITLMGKKNNNISADEKAYSMEKMMEMSSQKLSLGNEHRNGLSFSLLNLKKGLRNSIFDKSNIAIKDFNDIMNRYSFIKKDIKPDVPFKFMGRITNTLELENILRNNKEKVDFYIEKLHRSYEKNLKLEKNPLQPFTEGQIGLMLSSGSINGIVDKKGEIPHIIKGNADVKRTEKPDFNSVEFNKQVLKEKRMDVLNVVNRKEFCVNITCLTQDGILKKIL